MAISKENKTQNAFCNDSEDKENIQEGKSLLRRFLKEGGALNIQKNDIILGKENLQLEIEKLENSNHHLSKDLHQLELLLADKKEKSIKEFKVAKKKKKKQVRLLTEESSLKNEIVFYESELEKLLNLHEEISDNLDSSLKKLERSVRDIGFAKGETGVLIDKMSLLEDDVPGKHSDIEGIDDTVAGSVKALKRLYKRMHEIEISAKASYYNK